MGNFNQKSLQFFFCRLKEDTAVGSVIYHLTGFDGDNDKVTFGVTSNPDDVVKVVNDPKGKNEADVLLSRYVRKQSET